MSAFHIGWPEGIYLFLTIFALGITLAKHGEPNTGKNNIWVSLIASGIHFAIMWWGGFFA